MMPVYWAPSVVRRGPLRSWDLAGPKPEPGSSVAPGPWLLLLSSSTPAGRNSVSPVNFCTCQWVILARPRAVRFQIQLPSAAGILGAVPYTCSHAPRESGHRALRAGMGTTVGGSESSSSTCTALASQLQGRATGTPCGMSLSQYEPPCKALEQLLHEQSSANADLCEALVRAGKRPTTGKSCQGEPPSSLPPAATVTPHSAATSSGG